MSFFSFEIESTLYQFIAKRGEESLVLGCGPHSMINSGFQIGEMRWCGFASIRQQKFSAVEPDETIFAAVDRSL